MATTYTASFVLELINGVHDLDTDTLKLALFSDSASPGVATTAYSTSNEISGTGYTAGGATMALSSGYPQVASNGVGQVFRFDDVEWASASFTARWGLIYNSSQSDKAVMVLDFGQNRQSVSSTFAVRFPLTQPPLIRVGG
jgi:hypothetical protein